MGSSQKGYDAEITALDILEKEGYEILYAPEKLKRERVSKFPSLKEWIKLQHKLEGFGYGVYHVEKLKRIKTSRDKKCLRKSKDVKLTQSQKNELVKLINKWNKWNMQREESHNYYYKIEKLLTKVIGDSVIPESAKENHEEIINKEEDPRWKEFWKISLNSASQNTFVDIFCKKNKDHYIFDVKQKIFIEKKNPNQFSVTNYEVLNYDRINKENKVKLRILIIVEKGKESLYKMFEWSDFTYSKNYDPHKTRKTSIRLKAGLDLAEFQEWKYN